MTIAVPVIVNVAVRSAPALAASANWTVPDPEPEAPFDHVLEARPATVRAALSNSFGFGGHNACLVFTRHDPAA